MIISTKFFGKMEIDDSNIINFRQGIPGFENLTRYVILDINDSDLKCLQSIDKSEVCLLLTSPWIYFKDYEIELSDAEIDELKIKTHEDIIIYNVVTVRENKITANLIAPIVINLVNKEAKQIVLSDNKYNIRQEIPCSY